MAMEFNCKAKAKARSRSKICLEEYLHFIDTRNWSNLPINHLNQIISMHGYKKLHKLPKTVLTDAVSTLTLVNPSRSTLNDNRIAPFVSTTLDDVMADLNELNWEECSTTSVHTLSSVSQSLLISSSPTHPHDPNQNQHYADCSIGQKKHRKALAEIGNNINGGFSCGPPLDGSFRRKLGRPKKKVPRRKKSIAEINGGDSDGRGNYLALDFFPIGPR